ncbi:MAG: class I SAM-dependent methyltransferase [Syntrophomonadaceae bacterium]|jgi:ubiquinone/menaquinone biosynthesis C-methylase UbiE|nr:class I SAM-dependent methyltransferase [Syntrophomonadaceae bacterium]
MFKGFIQNARKPQGLGGKIFIASMNAGHTALSSWGLSRLEIHPADVILDIGCGGGKNIKRMLKTSPEGKVCGLDYSELSVRQSAKLNRKAVGIGRAEIRLGSVSENPWPDDTFDIVTAFETVYFWPDFVNDLRECRRVLKPGGRLFICNEMNQPETGEMPYQYWIDTLNLNVYTETDFRGYLTEAGFDYVEMEAEGKSRVCVTARARKGSCV